MLSATVADVFQTGWAARIRMTARIFRWSGFSGSVFGHILAPSEFLMLEAQGKNVALRCDVFWTGKKVSLPLITAWREPCWCLQNQTSSSLSLSTRNRLFWNSSMTPNAPHFIWTFAPVFWPPCVCLSGQFLWRERHLFHNAFILFSQFLSVTVLIRTMFPNVSTFVTVFFAAAFVTDD